MEKRNRRTRTGVVISDKMDKTITVSVQHTLKHPIYKKIMRRTSKVLTHDENNECQIGDIVRIMETRPLSRHKRWRVSEIITKSL